MMIASDAGVGGTPFEGFLDSVAAGIHGLGITPEQAVRLATRVPAQALGLDELVGTVETGKRADLVLIAGDLAAGGAKAVRVWRDGKLVVDQHGLVARTS
jgi:imidazolonepropionase-like amidohydrolase